MKKLKIKDSIMEGLPRPTYPFQMKGRYKTNENIENRFNNLWDH